MQVSSFPDVRKFSALRERGADLKRGVEEAFRELTTGRMSTRDAIRNVNGKIGDAHLLRRDLDQVELRKTSFALASGRASIAQNSLTQVVNSVGSLPEDLASAAGRRDERALEVGSQQARTALDQAVSALNVRQGRRFLFSGDAVDRAPIASSEAIFNAVRSATAGATTAADVTAALDVFFGAGGEFETNLYTGGAGTGGAVEIGEGDRVSLEPRADDPAFREIIRGLATASIASEIGLSRDERDLLIDEAGQYMVSGIDETSRLVASLGLSEQRIEQARARLSGEETVLSEAYNAMTGRDAFDAASRAQELEALLQTTYSVTARLATLSFNNFIR